jgi:hypothetical protein
MRGVHFLSLEPGGYHLLSPAITAYFGVMMLGSGCRLKAGSCIETAVYHQDHSSRQRSILSPLTHLGGSVIRLDSQFWVFPISEPKHMMCGVAWTPRTWPSAQINPKRGDPSIHRSTPSSRWTTRETPRQASGELRSPVHRRNIEIDPKRTPSGCAHTHHLCDVRRAGSRSGDVETWRRGDPPAEAIPLS